MSRLGDLLIDSCDLDNDDLKLSDFPFLQELMDKKNSGSYWRVTGKNLGWQRRTGEKIIKADTIDEVIYNILPKTDNHYKIYNEKRGFIIYNSHHDALHEEYWVRPAEQRSLSF